ncbi:hypothetical protein [Pseudodesulfovibrio sp. zrk46]|uniref:hypothetical protein n=1 Tax=Pseudodesulfovibrio sp. zrk46 TaxID=2725288 RepID=UPI00144A2398|nr:hypothetical protein [Pseudodesulfovibrio sp. zrk46]QJB55906.1 hypothetical protein HFN16_05560 [Pseudodesulfovibrio sp. zrk46]
MKFRSLFLALFLLISASVANGAETDYLALLAEDSEIKAIAVVTNVRRMSNNSDGTFQHVTFKRIYGVTPFIPTTFVGGCKTMESRWQKRSSDMVYFNPRKGQKVYVTVTTNGGAITSFTPINAQLEAVLRQEPHRVAYSRGKAKVIPIQQ